MNNLSDKFATTNYEILERLGAGGMGAVYKARHKQFDRLVALKTLASNVADAEALARFQREGLMMSALNHKNIASFYEFGVLDDSTPFIAMEYVEGICLETYLLKQGRLEISEAVEIMIQVCNGMQHAHSNAVIHRDLKPGNIMLIGNATPPTIKLIDFGLSKLLPSATKEGQELTTDGQTIGTIQYMSPEQCLGGPVDHRCDIYAMGCIFFQCLAGLPPFAAEHTVQIMQQHVQGQPPNISNLTGDEVLRQAQQVINRALKKKPADRYDSAEQMAADLRQLSSAKGSSSSSKQLITVTRERRRGLDARKLSLTLVALVALFVLAATCLNRVKTNSTMSSTAWLQEARKIDNGLVQMSPAEKRPPILRALAGALIANESDNLLDERAQAWIHNKFAEQLIFMHNEEVSSWNGLPYPITMQAAHHLDESLRVLNNASLSWSGDQYNTTLLAEHGKFSFGARKWAQHFAKTLLSRRIIPENQFDKHLRTHCALGYLLMVLGDRKDADRLIARAEELDANSHQHYAELPVAKMQRCISDGKLHEAIAIGTLAEPPALRENLNVAKELCRASFYVGDHKTFQKGFAAIRNFTQSGSSWETGIDLFNFAERGELNKSMRKEAELVKLSLSDPLLALRYRAEGDLAAFEKWLLQRGESKFAQKVQADRLRIKAFTDDYLNHLQ